MGEYRFTAYKPSSLFMPDGRDPRAAYRKMLEAIEKLERIKKERGMDYDPYRKPWPGEKEQIIRECHKYNLEHFLI